MYPVLRIQDKKSSKILNTNDVLKTISYTESCERNELISRRKYNSSKNKLEFRPISEKSHARRITVQRREEMSRRLGTNSSSYIQGWWRFSLFTKS